MEKENKGSAVYAFFVSSCRSTDSATLRRKGADDQSTQDSGVTPKLSC